MNNCHICKNIIEENQPMIQCPHCGSAHHEECWIQNGGCTADGCGYQANAPQVAPANRYHCHQCGAVLQKGQYACPACGTLRRRSAAHNGAEITTAEQLDGEGNAFPREEAPVCQQPNSQPATPAKPPALGLSIAGLIMGILSLMFCWVPLYILPLIPLPALIMSICAKRKGGNSVATAGVVCSAIGLGINLIVTIVLLFLANGW